MYKLIYVLDFISYDFTLCLCLDPDKGNKGIELSDNKNTTQKSEQPGSKLGMHWTNWTDVDCLLT